eukprot:TRINITY_DN32025_c0_g1_i1.p1 TRINITY_DN32025_c0_g1~~TRINITY_DN32025_c0_g1_i1.p1  ORF type:complete len:667 (+),score=230.58 TRINITY_DN32025_c0_g1_i1:82-2082(+)
MSGVHVPLLKDVDSDMTVSEDVSEPSYESSSESSSMSAPSEAPGQRKMDAKVLRRAFHHIDDGDGEMSMVEFRRLYKSIFPDLEWNDETFDYTEWVFNEIDTDGSGTLTWPELLEYLEGSRQVYLSKCPPTTWRGRIWRVVGSDTIEYTDTNSWDAWVQRWYRVAAAVSTLVSYLCVFVWSMPEQEHKGHIHDPNAVPVLYGIETACMVWLLLELVLYVATYPTTKVRVDLKSGKETVVASDEEGPVSPRSSPPVEYKIRRYINMLKDKDFWMNMMAFLPWLALVIWSLQANLNELGQHRVADFLAMLKALRMVRFLRFAVMEVEMAEALMKGRSELMYLCVLVGILAVLAASFVVVFEIKDSAFSSADNAWIRNEDSSYPDAGQRIPFQSIPESLWWACVTLSTVGYGDVYPVTAGGKIVAVFTMLAGTVVVTYCISTVTSSFSAMNEEACVKKRREEHCAAFYHGIQYWVDDLLAREATLAAETVVPKSPASGPEAIPERDPVVELVGELREKFFTHLAGLDLQLGELEAAQEAREGEHAAAVAALEATHEAAMAELAAESEARAAAQALEWEDKLRAETAALTAIHDAAREQHAAACEARVVAAEAATARRDEEVAALTAKHEAALAELQAQLDSRSSTKEAPPGTPDTVTGPASEDEEEEEY